MNTSEDYVFLSHCVQHLVAACLTKDHDAVERAKRKLKDSNIASRIKDSLVLDDAIVLFNDANLYFMNESNDENDLERGFRMLAFQAMKDAMGSETVLLSDFYVSLAANLGAGNRLQEAIEFAGRGLLIRIRILGLLSLKTAESHFQLGNLYVCNENFEEGCRELFAARHIYCKLLGEKSAPATDCDMILGELESKRFHHKKAYAHYTRGFRNRYLSLGGNHELTLAAHERVDAARHELQQKCYLPTELLDRALEMDWHLEDANSFEHFLFIFLTQMNADGVIMSDEFALMVANAYGLYLINGKSMVSNNSAPSLSDFSTNPDNKSVLSTNSVFSFTHDASNTATNKTSEIRLWDNSELIEIVDSLLIRAFPQELSVNASSVTSNSALSASRSFPSSPVPLSSANHSTSPIPPLLRRTLSSKLIPTSSVSGSVSRSEAANNHEEGTRDNTIPRAEHSIDVNTIQLQNLNPDEEIKSMMEEDTTNIAAIASSVKDNSDSFKEGEKQLQEMLSKAKGFADKARIQQQYQQHSPNQSTPSSFNTPFMNASTNSGYGTSRPKHWKPIPLNSPLRTMTKKTVTIKNMKEDEMNYVRDDQGDLLAVAKCSISALHQQLRSRTVAFALIAWLSQNNLQERIAEGKKKRAMGGKKSLKLSDLGNGHPDEDGKDGAKNALNALFGGKGRLGSTVGGADMASTSVSGKGATLDGRKDCAKRVAGRLPMPPPLPTSWPPLPYEGSSASMSSGSGKMGSASGAGGTAADKKPKLKQLHLQPLPNLTGTFWESTNEPFFKSDELFDDLEEEFLIGGLKPKKLAFQQAGGSRSTAAASGKNTPGSGKVAQVESALDPQRAQNINIMLAKFGKRSLDAIAQSVINFEATSIGLATITSLQQFIPTIDEIAKVRAFVERKWKAAGVAVTSSTEDKLTSEPSASSEPATAAEKGGMATIAAAAAAAVARGGTAGKSKDNDKDDNKSVTSDPSSLPPSSEPGTPSPSPLPTSTAATKAGKKTLQDLSSKEIQDLRVGRAEQYIFVMSKVVGLDKRLSALSMVLSVQELHSYVVQNTEILLTACGEVRGSGRLRFILRAFLELNNALMRPPNMQKILQVTGANANANAKPATSTAEEVTEQPNDASAQLQGFGLLQWSKFALMKCNSGETAQTYIVHKLIQRIPEALMLGQDMPSIEEAKGVLLPRLAANVKKLEETVALLQELLAAEQEKISKLDEGTNAENNKFAEKNLQFALAETLKSTQDAQARHNQALTDFVQLAQYFGEQSPPVEAEQFFGELSALCKSLAAAVAVASNKSRRRALVTAVPH